MYLLNWYCVLITKNLSWAIFYQILCLVSKNVSSSEFKTLCPDFQSSTREYSAKIATHTHTHPGLSYKPIFYNISQAHNFAFDLFHQNDWTGKHIEIPYCVICGPSSIEKKSKTKLVKLANATVSTAKRIYGYKSKLHKRSIRTDFVTTQNELGVVKLSLWNTRRAAIATIQ